MKGTAGTVFVIIILAAIPAGLIWFNIATYKAWRKTKDLSDSGVAVQGMVLDKEKSMPAPRSVQTFTIKYKYSAKLADGSEKEFITEKKVDENTFLFATPNQPIDIIYQSDNPGDSDVKGNDDVSMRIFLTLLIDVAVILTVIFIAIKAAKESSAQT